MNVPYTIESQKQTFEIRKAVGKMRMLLAVLLLITGTWFATACSSSSDDPGLDGDLSIQIDGPPGTGMFVSYATWDASAQELDFDGTTANLPESGEFTMNIEGSGFDGLEVVVSLFDEESTVLVALLSDGSLVADTDNPDSDGDYVITVGNFPNFDF
ncbi:MAG: hypothetical protein LAT84_07540 [Balneolia bacterium]|nr:hypothetical protein [Balneolia bacterium]